MIGELTDSVEAEVDDLLTDGVVTTREAVGGILLLCSELLVKDDLSELGTDLVTALATLNVNDFSHFAVRLN